MSGAFKQDSGTVTPPYQATFTQADITVANIYPLIHGLDGYPSGITVWDSFGQVMGPDNIENVSINTASVYLTSFVPIVGTWTVSATL